MMDRLSRTKLETGANVVEVRVCTHEPRHRRGCLVMSFWYKVE